VAITNGYSTLNELKARLTISDSQDDSMLEACIEVASRQIDAFTGTRFYQASESRYYTPLDALCCAIDDCTNVTSVYQDLQTDRSYSDQFAATDYDLGPYNAALDGKPYQQILITPQAVKSFIVMPRAVKVTGSFGWSSSAPIAVKQACLLQAAMLFRRKDAPFGVAGGGEVGQQLSQANMDPAARLLLTPFRRLSVTSLV
jgi:hypothetical protein